MAIYTERQQRISDMFQIQVRENGFEQGKIIFDFDGKSFLIAMSFPEAEVQLIYDGQNSLLKRQLIKISALFHLDTAHEIKSIVNTTWERFAASQNQKLFIHNYQFREFFRVSDNSVTKIPY